MSTKIYNGVKLPPKPTLEALFEWVGSIRSPLQKVAQQHWFEAQCLAALPLYDRRFAQESGIEITESSPLRAGSNPFSVARRELVDTIEKAQREKRAYHLDMGFELAVIPHPSGLYGLTFSSCQELEKAFLALPGVERFVYFNNAEPNGVPRNEWEARGELWEELLGPSGMPSQRCASFMLIEEGFHWSAKHPPGHETFDATALISRKKRAHEVALTTAAARFEGDMSQRAGLSGIVAHLYALEAGEVHHFNEVRDAIENLLPQAVSYQDLVAPV